MITLQELNNKFISKKQNEDIRLLLSSIIIDRWLLKNKQKLFYNEIDKQTLDNFRVIDDKLFTSFKPKEMKVFKFYPDWWIIKEFFDNKPFSIELPVCESENKKVLRNDMIMKYFLWPLAKSKTIDDLLFIILKNIITVLWLYYDEDNREIWFWVKQVSEKVKIWNKYFKYKVKETTLEEVLQAEIDQWFVNKQVWDPDRDYAYTHMLRLYAKFKLFNWSKNVLIDWKKYNVLATSRAYWKTFFWAFVWARWLLDSRPWFWWRNYREIKIFVPNKEDIGMQYMTYIKSMIWNLKSVKLESWMKAFEFWTWSIKCNITWNILKIISLNNIDKEWKWELGTARWEWLACDLAIIDEAARIPNYFWTSFHQRAAFETQEFLITSTINAETPVDHWFYELLIDWESWDENIASYRLDIENNEAMMTGKSKEEWQYQLEAVKETLRKWWEKEFYSKWYCIILEESNVFNLNTSIVTSNKNKYQDSDIRILWFDLWKLDDSAALILFNLTHREIEESMPVYNASYWTQLSYAKDYKKKYKNIFIIWDRSWVWESVSEQDTEWVVDCWIKSTGQWWLSYNKQLNYYTCSKWLIITTLATIFNLWIIKIPADNDLLIKQLNSFVKMKSWRSDIVLYMWKNKTKDDLVLATAYAWVYMYLILWLKTIKDIEDYVKSIWYNQTYYYNDTEVNNNYNYYNSLY